MNDLATIIAETAGITTLTKVLVDLLKAYAPNDLQPWILPMCALALGLAFAFLLAAAADPVWRLPLVATTTIRGVMGGCGAVAATELHKIVRSDKQ